MVRTSGELGVVGEVVLVEVLRLLLGLLVVDGVCTGYCVWSAFVVFDPASIYAEAMVLTSLS